jgi:hypothetical protein
MTNPVVTALTLQKANELRQRNDAVAHDLQIRIGVAPPPSGELPSTFVRWCRERGVIPLPAKPESVALFLLQSRDLGVDSAGSFALCRPVQQLGGSGGIRGNRRGLPNPPIMAKGRMAGLGRPVVACEALLGPTREGAGRCD